MSISERKHVSEGEVPRGELRFSLARGGGEVGAPERSQRLSPRASRKAFGPAMSRVVMA